MVARGAMPCIMSSRSELLVMSVISLANVHFKYNLTVFMLCIIRSEKFDTVPLRSDCF